MAQQCRCLGLAAAHWLPNFSTYTVHELGMVIMLLMHQTCHFFKTHEGHLPNAVYNYMWAKHVSSTVFKSMGSNTLHVEKLQDLLFSTSRFIHYQTQYTKSNSFSRFIYCPTHQTHIQNHFFSFRFLH